MPRSNDESGPKYQPMGGCVAFIVWSFGGSLVLFLWWALILQTAPMTVTVRDAAFWLTVLVMLGARLVSLVRYGAGTESGRVLDRGDFKVYALLLLGISSVGWVVAQSVGI